MPEPRIIKANGVDVSFLDEGSGSALVMLHGSGPGASGWSNYSRNITAFSKHYRVICPDLPGFGASEVKPIDGPIPGFWADIIAALLDELGIPKAHFIGNSMGGMVALKIALERPTLVDKLILMGPGGGYAINSNFPTPAIINLLT